MVKIDSRKQNIAKNIAQKYSLELILLFGSQVTGKTHKESDFDIAYLSSKNFSLEDEGKLINDLIPVLSVSDERLINLVNIKNSSPLLLYSITLNSKVLFATNELTFPSLRAYAFKSYIDMKPIYQERERRLQKELAFI